MNYIVNNIELPADIQVYSKNSKITEVKLVMNNSKVKGKCTGGAMVTSNWMDVVEHNNMKVGDIYVFWFRGSRDGLKLSVFKA